MTAATLLDRLQGVRATGLGQWTARCPAHADRSPSLSVRELADGQVLVHCFAGCGAAEVLAAVGLEFGELFPERREEPMRHVAMPDRWALTVLARESLVVGLAASEIAEGRSLTPADADRIAQAAGRIASVVALAHVR